MDWWRGQHDPLVPTKQRELYRLQNVQTSSQARQQQGQSPQSASRLLRAGVHQARGSEGLPGVTQQLSDS